MKRIPIVKAAEKGGEEVKLAGWVNSRRDHGKIIFLDLRDASGLIQSVATPKEEQAYETANSLGAEDVVEVVGEVKARPQANVNPDLETGKVELTLKQINLINKANELPFPIDTPGTEIDELVRMKYRYIDLRRQRLQTNLKTRHRIAVAAREFLNKENFVEIETPYLTKTTPEGARDFVVPSRHQKGNFYALAQAPQQYKQLLMISGFEKYYQLSRAFRDEDLRADRQMEHTQIDLEMAFVEREDILNLVEEMITFVAEKMGKKILEKPFPRFTHTEAMKQFGADKFDLRNKNQTEELAFAFVLDFPLFERDEEEKAWTFSHNPFTAPKPEDEEKLKAEKEIAKISSLQYDLVCNGFEMASGSIRINKPEVQRQALKIMGYSKEKIESDFGHLLKAYEYGAPVHGGIAIGLERLTAVFTGESSIREVVAFPVTSSGETSVMDAPSRLDEKQLKELGLKLDKK
ncbi:MAG: aspartate--tRNA ligase [bacterium]|nr:aspartate--tRNA ligase [bacterium]